MLKLFSFALIILIFLAGNTINPRAQTLSRGTSKQQLYSCHHIEWGHEFLAHNTTKNNPSCLSLGFGRMFDFRDDSELNLLLSADFTLYFNPTFFIKLNYDNVFSRSTGHRNVNLFTISPGICIKLNKVTAVHFSAGLGIANDIFPFFPVTAAEFEYKISKRFSSGIEIKYPVGSRVLPVNLNMIYNLY